MIKERYLPALFILVVFISVFSIVGISFHNNPVSSVEVGFSALSPGGIGAVIPASCGTPHSGDLCTPPTFSNDCGGTINSGGSCTLQWTCFDSPSSSGVNFSTGGATSGAVAVFPTSTTQFTVVCSNGGQAQQTVTVLNPEITITADPTLVQPGFTSEIEWVAENVTPGSCTVTGPSFSETGESGTEDTAPITQQSTYVLACSTAGGPISESVVVNVVPTFEEF